MRERRLKWREMGNTRGRRAIKARESLNLSPQTLPHRIATFSRIKSLRLPFLLRNKGSRITCEQNDRAAMIHRYTGEVRYFFSLYQYLNKISRY